ncbi:hypothetical protein L1987_60061 [Smallanthus sonchifolius]|uniref:Uncharacterized protein n=1 Tax=Smallanthus sonchifolius TaxID=185202 RepID=A0ACB9D795_9ASTR|nr:hypothetical protein L1987_60061 [Smallanthus sonchifolius]
MQIISLLNSKFASISFALQVKELETELMEFQKAYEDCANLSYQTVELIETFMNYQTSKGKGIILNDVCALFMILPSPTKVSWL